MNGFIARNVLAACLLGGLGLVVGCATYRNLVDPCYPERYQYMARQEVCKTLVPQVNNGHILDQTVWNYHFEPNTDKLTAGGRDNLARLARRRPAPDPTIFLQTAQDVIPTAPEKAADERTALDGKRMQAIQAYLGYQTADRPMGFEVVIHDPGEVGSPAALWGTSQGGLNDLRGKALQQNVGTVIQSAPGRFPGSTGVGGK